MPRVQLWNRRLGSSSLSTERWSDADHSGLGARSLLPVSKENGYRREGELKPTLATAIPEREKLVRARPGLTPRMGFLSRAPITTAVIALYRARSGLAA